MSGNDWFPLHFDRLRKSKWWRRASDLARARNVMLWGEAYKQVPGGSMPDDDDELAEAAGFGMDVDAFIAVKAEIMTPWVLCSDGRWYHPTVCEVVLDAWDRASDRRKAAAERQRRRRQKTRGVTSEIGGVTPAEHDFTRDEADVTRDSAEIGRDSGIQTRQTGQDTTDKPPLPPRGDEQADLDLCAAPPKARRKPQCSIPPSFPDAEAILAEQLKARAAGADVDAAYQAGRFRNWAEGKDAKYADWPATWRNWMLKAVKEAPRSIAHRGADQATANPWTARVREFKRNVYWNAVDWGPAPGRPGCAAPAEIQREFGIEPAAPQQVDGRAA
jgi:hypothetical protein